MKLQLRRPLLVTSVGLGSLLLGALTASAQFFPTDIFFSPTDSLWPELNGVYDEVHEQLETTFSDLIRDQLRDVVVGIDGIIDASLGELGISDLRFVEQLLDDALEAVNQEFALGLPPSIIQREDLRKTINREQVKARAQAVIGRTGQDLLRLKLDQIEQDLWTVDGLAEEAQGEIATQDVMKRMSTQMAMNTHQLGAMHTAVLDNRIDTQLQGQVLVDMSEALAAERREQVQQDLAMSAELFTSASQVYLSLTSPE